MSDPAKPAKAKATLTENEISTGSAFGRRAFLIGAFGGTTALAGCVTTGLTDADPVDPAGGGRGGRYRTGLTDSDPYDPVGNGRGRRVCTDSDGGRYADPVNGGRRC